MPHRKGPHSPLYLSFKDKLQSFDRFGNSMDRRTIYWHKFDHSCRGVGREWEQQEQCFTSGWEDDLIRLIKHHKYLRRFCEYHIFFPFQTLSQNPFNCHADILVHSMSSPSAHKHSCALIRTPTPSSHLRIMANRHNGHFWGDVQWNCCLFRKSSSDCLIIALKRRLPVHTYLSLALTTRCYSVQYSTRLKYRKQSNSLSQVTNYTITPQRLSSLKCIHSHFFFISE